jgi:hypothetical protein
MMVKLNFEAVLVETKFLLSGASRDEAAKEKDFGSIGRFDA